MGTVKSELFVEGHGDWDVDALTEEIWLEFEGTVSRMAVREVVSRLFAQYEDAPVKHFVPMVVRRKAKEELLEGNAI